MLFALLIRILCLGFEFVSVFAMLCHYMLFYGTYVGKLIGKSTRECRCCMANVSISCYVSLQTRPRSRKTSEKN